MLSVQVLDFESYCPLIQHGCLYAVPVRQASDLRTASFRSHLAVDTLAVRLTLPPVRCVENLHLIVRAPCRAHNKKAGRFLPVRFLRESGFYYKLRPASVVGYVVHYAVSMKPPKSPRGGTCFHRLKRRSHYVSPTKYTRKETANIPARTHAKQIPFLSGLNCLDK